jgi:hypothetical protein
MKKTISILVISILFGSCSRNERISNIYRYYWGKSGGYDVWIVDGGVVRQKIYKEFLYGGNEQRYIFNPRGEIWIDNAISSEEFDLTLAHELNERHLMAKFGWTYENAHDSSLMLEQVIRHKNMETCLAHESILRKVSVLDSYNIKEIKSLPDSVYLQNIYRIPMGLRDGVFVWVVDGYLIRKNIYPDFGFSGNDLAYHFIPPNETWIDGQVSCEETEYSIALELTERNLKKEGKTYSDAYEAAVQMIQDKRIDMEKTIKSHPGLILPDSLERDSGVIDPDEKEFHWPVAGSR